jgi:hypothetical protein
MCLLPPCKHRNRQRPPYAPGLPDFSWYNLPKWGKSFQMTVKYTKWPQTIPNGSKIDQVAIRCANIFFWKTLRNFPELGFLVWNKSSGNSATLAARTGKSEGKPTFPVQTWGVQLLMRKKSLTFWHRLSSEVQITSLAQSNNGFQRCLRNSNFDE